MIKTDPQLQVIGCSLRQCGAEPWRVVEFTAGTSRATPLAIPQRVILKIFLIKMQSWVSSVTKIAVSNKCWHLIRPGEVSVGTGTAYIDKFIITTMSFKTCSGERPDVLA